MAKVFRTSELLQAAGVNRATLRYYERRGLLHEPERTKGGHRLYPSTSVRRIQIIKAAQRLGFSLKEILEMLELCDSTVLESAVPKAVVAERAYAKLRDIDARIADLRALRATVLEALQEIT